MFRFLIILPLILTATPCRSEGPYPYVDPRIVEWFSTLRQPDAPRLSCCGEADAFLADDYAAEGDHYVAIITEGRGIWPNGTRIVVPNQKINIERPNPTGRGWVFLKAGTKEVLCYAPPSGL